MFLGILISIGVIGIIIVTIDCILIGKYLKKMDKENQNFKDKYPK